MLPPLLQFSEGTLTLKGMAHRGLQRLFPDVFWIDDRRTGSWRCDALHYRHVCEGFQRFQGEFRDEVPQWMAIHPPKQNFPQLRSEQRHAVEAWRSHDRRGILVMPTGTGKTEVALSILAELSTSTLIVAPVRDLMYQWHQRILDRLGIDAGLIGDSVYRVSPLSVTTYDSACIHMPVLGNRFALLIFDECHHLPGPIRRDAARMSAAPFRLGLTATLTRSDGRHTDLHELIGPVVYELSLPEVKGKTLADYQVIRISIHLADEERQRYVALSRTIRQFMADKRREQPNFQWHDVCTLSDDDPAARQALRAFHARQAIEDRAQGKLRILEDLFRLHVGEPVLVFTGSNAMAREVSLRFLIPSILSHCGKRERREILQGLASGTYPAVVANRVLDEGVDLPEVKVAIVLGGLASQRQAKQRLGRVLRRAGNQAAILYEVVAANTGDVARSRERRRTDAYQGTRHRQI